MITNVIDLFPVDFRTKLMKLVDGHAETICSNFPKPYGDEIV